ncbi:DNA cytosine methyltransferase [Thermoactinomyces sp. CICC 10521]|uniref:DNA cytosine methyltransferase n=1 Tax=Thermoactinomyces sp. CICC 10521 TaxID=2767426 RepID=UPI0018DC0B49|nr:DNA cytosine methyltransferase [Thermoactinomyces sp. CICC 10521]MBH8606011.1 DNA cytosine methyltransferase [Thermoactinomyces sp. CICC 10521]
MRVLDLFSGIGGFSLAAHWAGMETAAFCEIETFCQKVLRKNFPGVPIYDDVRSVTKEQLERDGVINGDRTIELVCGGFPCQPFSVAGKQRGKEDDRHLWPEMFRIIKELRPAWVVGENVTGLIKLALDDVIADLESEGYTVRAFIIPAAAVGAPHRRDRVWIVGDSNRQRCNSGSSDWQERQVHNYKERDYQKTCANRKQLQSQPWPNGKILANTDSAGWEKRHLATVTEGTGFSTRGADPRRAEAQSRLGRVPDGRRDGQTSMASRIRATATPLGAAESSRGSKTQKRPIESTRQRNCPTSRLSDITCHHGGRKS